MSILTVCLDGTWNIRDDTTNVWRIHTLIADQTSAGERQVKYYDQGVGTKWYDSLTGGAFGAGLYENVRQAYNWIAEVYRPGDSLFLFGFSRGAATALSLANLIDRCGIVGPDTYNTFEDAYRLYRLRGVVRSSPSSIAFRHGAAESRSDRPPLRFLGLFDAVDSLYLRRLLGEAMHVFTLPETVEQVCHAIAIDENRRLFQPVRFPSAPTLGRLHERWFAGAHANIGGGYAFDPLSTAPLEWMLSQAQAAGLRFRGIPRVKINDVLSARERNSHDEFAFGIPALLSRPFDHHVPALSLLRHRLIGRDTTGTAEEWIDASAVARFLRFETYRRSCTALSKFFDGREIDDGDIDVNKHRNANADPLEQDAPTERHRTL